MSELSVLLSDDPLPLFSLLVYDNRHAATIKDNILNMSLSLSITRTTELAFTVFDDKLTMEQNRYFWIGRTIAFYGRIYEITAVEVTYNSTPTVSVTCRPKAVQEIRRYKNRTPVNSNEAASDVAAETAKRFKLDFFGQPSPPTGGPITAYNPDNQDENMWDVLYQHAREIDYDFFEANGVLFFASKAFILEKQPHGRVEIDYPIEEDLPLYPLEPSTFRRSEDSRSSATASLVFRRTQASVSLFPGMRLDVKGLQYFAEPFMIDSVTIPVAKGMPVQVTASSVEETPDTTPVTNVAEENARTAFLLGCRVPVAAIADILQSWRNGVSTSELARDILNSGVSKTFEEIVEALNNYVGTTSTGGGTGGPTTNTTKVGIVWDWNDLESMGVNVAALRPIGWVPNRDVNPANGRGTVSPSGSITKRDKFIVLHTSQSGSGHVSNAALIGKGAAPGDARRVIVNDFLHRVAPNLPDKQLVDDARNAGRSVTHGGYHVLVDEGGWIELFDHDTQVAFHTSGTQNGIWGQRGLGIAFACYHTEWQFMDYSRKEKLWANVKDYLEYKGYTAASGWQFAVGLEPINSSSPVGVYSHMYFQPTSTATYDARQDPGPTFPWYDFVTALQ